MRNKRNRRSKRIEPQSLDWDENNSETSFTQDNATLVDVSENVNNIFDRKLGSDLTEPTQISNEVEAISQRFSEQTTPKWHKLSNNWRITLKKYSKKSEQTDNAI